MNYDSKIAELEKEIAKLKHEKAEWEALPEQYRLATILHSKQCHSSHEDQCGWHWENWDSLRTKNYSTRLRYVEKAEKMLQEVDYETAEKMIRLI